MRSGSSSPASAALDTPRSMPPCSFGRRACRPGWSSRPPTPQHRRPRTRSSWRSRRRERRPKPSPWPSATEGPASWSRSRTSLRRSFAAASDVVLPLHAGIETSGVSSRTFLATTAVLHLLSDRLRGRACRRRRPSAGCRWARRPARGSGIVACDDGRAFRRRRRNRRHRAGEQPGTGRTGRVAVPRGATHACLGARSGRLAPHARSTPRSRDTAPCSCRARRDPGRLAGVIAARGGATVAVGAREEHTTIQVPLPAGAPTRFVTPAVADVLAAELWSRASGKTP